MQPININNLINNLYEAAEKNNLNGAECLKLCETIDLFTNDLAASSAKKLTGEQSEKILEVSKKALKNFDLHEIGETENLINWVFKNSHYNSNGEIDGAHKSLHHLLKVISEIQKEGKVEESTLAYIDTVVIEKMKFEKLESELVVINKRWFNGIKNPLDNTQKTQLYEDTLRLAESIKNSKLNPGGLAKLSSLFKKFSIENWGLLSHWIAQNSSYMPKELKASRDSGGAFEAFSILIDSISTKEQESSTEEQGSFISYEDPLFLDNLGKAYLKKELSYPDRHPRDIIAGAQNLLERTERKDIFQQPEIATDTGKDVRETFLSNSEILTQLAKTSKRYNDVLKDQQIEDINAGRLSFEELGFLEKLIKYGRKTTVKVDGVRTLYNVINYFGKEKCKKIKKVTIEDTYHSILTRILRECTLAELIFSNFPNVENLTVKTSSFLNHIDIKNVFGTKYQEYDKKTRDAFIHEEMRYYAGLPLNELTFIGKGRRHLNCNDLIPILNGYGKTHLTLILDHCQLGIYPFVKEENFVWKIKSLNLFDCNFYSRVYVDKEIFKKNVENLRKKGVNCKFVEKGQVVATPHEFN